MLQSSTRQGKDWSPLRHDTCRKMAKFASVVIDSLGPVLKVLGMLGSHFEGELWADRLGNAEN